MALTSEQKKKIKINKTKTLGELRGLKVETKKKKERSWGNTAEGRRKRMEGLVEKYQQEKFVSMFQPHRSLDSRVPPTVQLKANDVLRVQNSIKIDRDLTEKNILGILRESQEEQSALLSAGSFNS